MSTNWQVDNVSIFSFVFGCNRIDNTQIRLNTNMHTHTRTPKAAKYPARTRIALHWVSGDSIRMTRCIRDCCLFGVAPFVWRRCSSELVERLGQSGRGTFSGHSWEDASFGQLYNPEGFTKCAFVWKQGDLKLASCCLAHTVYGAIRRQYSNLPLLLSLFLSLSLSLIHYSRYAVKFERHPSFIRLSLSLAYLLHDR